MPASPTRYSSVAIALHWLIAFLIIGQAAAGLYMHNLPATTLKFELYQWHKSFGVTILFLSFLRLFWRLTHKPPALPGGMAAWERFAARVSHVGFYVLIIAVPIVGWAMVSASPKDVPTVLFGAIAWPHMPGIPQGEGLEDILKETHEYMAFTILGLLVLHVGAALKHHFVNRDGVLSRMLPFLKRSS